MEEEASGNIENRRISGQQCNKGEMGGKKKKVFFFKQKTEYEIPKRGWSSDVCSSDLGPVLRAVLAPVHDVLVIEVQEDPRLALEAHAIALL